MPWSKIKYEDKPIEEGEGRLLDYASAMNEAFFQILKNDARTIVMGQGVDDMGGMFGATKDLHKKFGDHRVFDTPLAENGLMGIAVGMAINGLRPIYCHNRPDFLLLAMDQIVNHAAKWQFMFGGKSFPVPLVIWSCVGRGWGSASQHSQALHNAFLHYPGLKIVLPSNSYDSKGLLLSAVADNNPVLFFEHRLNFKYPCYVPEEMYAIPLGKGLICKEGKDLTIVAVSHIINDLKKIVKEYQRADIELIDLRTIKPIDKEIIFNSVAKTGRLLVVDSAWETQGLGNYVISLVAMEGIKLKTKPRIVANPDTYTPAGYTLEEEFFINDKKIIKAINQCLE
ncbi:MAG: alpha-ketoacid dehydrogenase subunit beta [Candidatus Moranbacteria bacterium CG_4_9_14_3_um_filter_36_9]|nr:MAG: alpha-ketoacid dehydrogenase subunit beta [Candidatus Moranbacteria bacterium CG_4_9_14_3_um_filter_36_9]